MGQQRFDLLVRGREHTVTATELGVQREIVWTVDGAEVARTKTTDDNAVLEANGYGRVKLKASMTGVHRATLSVGQGAVDMEPEPGSRAARREERIRQHPRRHAVVEGVLATVKVLAPLFGVGFVVNLLPDWDLPDIPWPDIPWPSIDLPDIPWPSIDLPSIPWPDWSLPGWLDPVLDAARFVLPVLVAIGVAMGEVKRRQAQDARRVEVRGQSRPQLETRMAADLRALLDQRQQPEAEDARTSGH
ncbi:hypothetical protein [Knoellia koreensis]|uniref:Uncharacterized protein n=1 Tax=Knoellia koreensis TaxID=2730921 RepID=A0A849HI13_9MICO|nr:hypothetical protein [Knoellia sp. DB2414S]NNM46842.1 hypothetical protein [Knoellia sp. DB2414S]